MFLSFLGTLSDGYNKDVLFGSLAGIGVAFFLLFLGVVCYAKNYHVSSDEQVEEVQESQKTKLKQNYEDFELEANPDLILNTSGKENLTAKVSLFRKSCMIFNLEYVNRQKT